ncbi:MAG TPA: rubredoxin [Anaerovoracaceae bacterium]|nr:rubredoxin [Anaerovoracaceae bacterium]
MHNIRKITKDMYWIGGNDRKINQFEGSIPIDKGISYNSYFVDDYKTVLLDTVDNAVSKTFFENLQYALKNKKLDFVIVNHLEPDHSGTLNDLLIKYQDVTIVGTEKIKVMAKQFLNIDIENRFHVIDEGDVFKTGNHEFTFVKAPMVHWPEVMVTYDKTDDIVYSADAFGAFDALKGNIYSDEYDFNLEWLPAARKYYTNIVGKYGMFTEKLLTKLEDINPSMICPLHGPIIRKDLSKYVEVYHKWARYIPEVNGVLVLYASVYGNTKEAVEIVASKMSDLGIDDMKIYDVSETDPSIILSETFKYSHILIASVTHNGGIFIKMEQALLDIKVHNLSNRKVAIIENGSWGPTSGELIKCLLGELDDITFIGDKVTIRSSVKDNQIEELYKLAEKITKSVFNREKLESDEEVLDMEAKKYVCKVCGYVYDEAKQGKWEDLPDDYKCPICGVGKEKFELKA